MGDNYFVSNKNRKLLLEFVTYSINCLPKIRKY